jgi:hypothetical protein
MSQLPRHRGDRAVDGPQAQADPLTALFDHEFRAQSWSESGSRIKVLAADVLPGFGEAMAIPDKRQVLGEKGGTGRAGSTTDSPEGRIARQDCAILTLLSAADWQSNTSLSITSR